MQTETYKYLQRMRSELLEQLRAEFGIARASGALGPPQPGAAEVPLSEEGRTLPGTPTALAPSSPAPGPGLAPAGSDRFARALFGDYSAPLPQGTDPGRAGEIKALRTASLCAAFDASPAPLRNLGRFAVAAAERVTELASALERLERENHALETEVKMYRAPEGPPSDDEVPPTQPPARLEEFRGPVVAEGPLELEPPKPPAVAGLRPAPLIGGTPPAEPSEPSEPTPATST